MLSQKRNASVGQSITKHLTSESCDLTQLVTVASFLDDAQILSDVQVEVVKKLKNKFESAFKSGNLSEVFSTAFILTKHDATFMEGGILAKLITLLTLSEVVIGGPYASKNSKVDLVSNVFIALFLESQNVELRNLDEYIRAQLKEDTFLKNSSDRSIVLYFASQLKNADHECIKQLIKKLYLLEPEHGELLDCILLKMNERDESLFITSPLPRNSSAISTVAVLWKEKYIKNHKCATLKPSSNGYSDQIYKIVKEESASYSEPLKTYLLNINAKIMNADRNGEISLFAHNFVDALQETEVLFQNNDLDILGAANVFCWAAYTLYDDFIDQEGQVEYLPVANCAMRKSVTLLTSVFKLDEQHSLMEFLFDCMDQANAWELENTRFKVTGSIIFISKIPNYDDLSILSNRAAGHIVAPLCLAKQYNYTHEQHQHLRQALHHYLVARQLNDDIHDWVEDIKNGHCTYVLSCMLRDAKIAPGAYSHFELSALLKSYFWNRGFEESARTVLRHVELSKRSFSKTKKFKAGAVFFRYLDSIESSIHEAQKRFVHKKQFIKQLKKAD